METKTIDDDKMVLVLGQTELMNQTRDTYEALHKVVMSDAIVGIKKVIIDISAINFIDSFGISALVMFAKVFLRNEGKVAAVCKDARIGVIFDMLKLQSIMPIFDSTQQALEYLNGNQA